MRPLWIVSWFEFVRTLNKPSFWVRTLAVPVLMAAVLGVSVFSNRTAKQASNQAAANPFSVAVHDASGFLPPALLKAEGVQIVAGTNQGIAAVKQGAVDAFFDYPVHPTQEAVHIYAQDDGLIKNGKYAAVATALLQAGVAKHVGGGEAAILLQRPPATELVTYQNGQETNGFGRVIAPGVFLVLFYIVIVLMGNQMLTSTTEEKENRVIEMILTSVSARTVIIGKIISLVALGVIQIAVILVPLVIAYGKFRSELNIPSLDLSTISFAPWPIITGAALFIGGFILFTGMLVSIGSAVPTAKEAGSYFAVAIILMFIPIYAAGAIVSTPDQAIVKVMSVFPLTVPITLMLRNAVGNLTPAQTISGLIILYVAAAALMWLAIRVFRFGSLEYTRKLGLKEILHRRA